MMKEKVFGEYTVLEIKRNGIYNYYLEKQGYGDLLFMYGTEEECFPEEDGVSESIKEAEDINFWNE